MELIFEHLEWYDLPNIADGSKIFYKAVCAVFKRNYTNEYVRLGDYNHKNASKSSFWNLTPQRNNEEDSLR